MGEGGVYGEMSSACAARLCCLEPDTREWCDADATRRDDPKVMPRWMFIVLEFKGEGRLLWLLFQRCLSALGVLRWRPGREGL